MLVRLTNPLSYENQLLTVTILTYIEDSVKELGTATIGYSQLLAHAETRSKGILLPIVGSEYYEFTVDGSTSSVLILVACAIRTSVPPPKKQHSSAEPVFSPGRSKSDEGRTSSNSHNLYLSWL